LYIVKVTFKSDKLPNVECWRLKVFFRKQLSKETFQCEGAFSYLD